MVAKRGKGCFSRKPLNRRKIKKKLYVHLFSISLYCRFEMTVSNLRKAALFPQPFLIFDEEPHPA